MPLKKHAKHHVKTGDFGHRHSDKIPGKHAANFVGRNLMGTSPISQQFEPTTDCPINAHKRMAGAG